MNQEDMYKQKALLVENRLWFNGFFQDLSGLLERMYRQVEKKIGANWRGYYYPKSNFTPGIPDFLVMGLNCDGVTLQIYFILNPDMLRREFSKAEPSFVVIRLSQTGFALSVNDYGWRAITDDNVTTSEETSHLSGQLPNGLHFQAFQIVLDPFIGTVDADAVIDRELIQRVAQLPDFKNNDNP